MKSLIKKLSYLGILLVVFGFSQTAHAAECEMISREFKNHSLKPKVSLVVGQTVTLAITTKNCIGKRINIQIIEGRGTYNEETEVNVLNSIIDNNIVTTTYEVGDHDCSSLTFGSDCIYDTKITIFDPADNKALVSYGHGSVIELFDIDTQLFFHCHIEPTVNERKCTKNWVFKSATGIKKADGSEIGLVIPGVVYDVNSPCYDSTISKYTEGCYEMLAPIPGIGSKYTDGAGVERDTGFTEKDGRQTVNTKKMQIGDYLNQIFRVALGILALIAVIMIIIAGVEYMVVESIYGKSAAKERIINAVTGLLIGLGIFLILSTINPKLLEVNFAPPTVAIKFESDPGDGYNYDLDPNGISQSAMPASGTNIKGCPEGIISVSNILICKSMAKGLDDLLKEANQNGYTLTGKGYRSYESQYNLRVKNNCPDPVNSPSNQCNPHTAKPGKSNHEAGLAVDFRCNNAKLGGSQCFQWMKLNAEKHGFKNYPPEPWHWSFNGK